MAKFKITITEVHIDLEGGDRQALPDLFTQAFAAMMGRAKVAMEPAPARRPSRRREPKPPAG